MTKYIVAIAIILAITAIYALTQSATKQSATRKSAAPNTAAPTKVIGDGVRTPSGLVYWDIRVGTGELAKEGSHVRVHYTGWLTNGKKFDSSVDAGQRHRKRHLRRVAGEAERCSCKSEDRDSHRPRRFRKSWRLQAASRWIMRIED